ncbi:MAG: HEAT repeat domain-containing protein [Candidatus Hodarchaeales archaeon]
MRQGAVEALRKIGDSRAVEPLKALLKERARLVREATKDALEKLDKSMSSKH